MLARVRNERGQARDERQRVEADVRGAVAPPAEPVAELTDHALLTGSREQGWVVAERQPLGRERWTSDVAAEML